MRQETLAYRADIDGLRAIAIVAVVLFHFTVPGFRGGFVGVDVFFVISGFLITSIITSQLSDGTFTINRFYERRIRRLLPTLALVLAATMVAGLVLMPAPDLKRLAGSIFYTLILGANFYFADRGNYFESWVDEAPLLHMWSLAVEEQFYLVWPLLLSRVLWRRRERLVMVAGAIWAASLLASLHAAWRFPVEGFYLPHTRAWELMTGCLLALGLLAPPRTSAIANLASLIGLGAIAIAVVGYDQTVVMPGIAAALPVAGTFLVIWSGSGTSPIVNRALSWRPLVLVGLVSYAWYVWHWPLLAFFRYARERNPDAAETAVLIGASLLLAVACWRFLEVPIRARAGSFSQRRLFLGAGATGLALLAATGVITLTGGLPARLSPEVNALARDRIDLELSSPGCDTSTAAEVRAGALCIFGPRSDDGGILLWGDSHAWALRPAFLDFAETEHRTVTYVARTGCPPLVDAWPRQRGGRAESCADFNTAVRELVESGRFSDVVLVARWNFYALGPAAETSLNRERFLQDAQSTEASTDESRAVIERGLARTLQAVAKGGARAWVVAEVPDMRFDVPGLMARRLMHGRPIEPLDGPEVAEREERGRFMNDLVARLGQQLPVQMIDPGGVLCDASTCRAQENGQPLYRDDNHLSPFGARHVAPLLSQILR